jgi:hypothetical protein
MLKTALLRVRFLMFAGYMGEDQLKNREDESKI